jgi:hypothetical protein
MASFLSSLGLNQGIGGMQQAQGPNMTGDAGVGPATPIGPSYNDILKTALTYGSKNPTTKQAAGLMPITGQYRQPTVPLGPKSTDIAPPLPQGQGTGNALTGIAQSIFGGLLGV